MDKPQLCSIVKEPVTNAYRCQFRSLGAKITGYVCVEAFVHPDWMKHLEVGAYYLLSEIDMMSRPLPKELA